MQKPQKTVPQPLCYDFLLYPGFSAHGLANAVEPLRAANTFAGRSLYRWRFLSLTAEQVVSSSGLEVTTQRADRQEGDMLFVIPSYGYLDHSGFIALRDLRRLARGYGTLVGLDTGPWLLAAAGLLDGYRATIHRDKFSDFEESFPKVEAQVARYVLDRDRITCPGAAACFDLVLHLITAQHGSAMGLELSRIFMMQDREEMPGLVQPAGDRLVDRVVGIMSRDLEQPCRIGEIAAEIGCSQRTLELRLRQRLGMSPRALYRRLKLAQVRKLLQETELSIAEISLRAGYENASAMARAFRAEFGLTPSALRAGNVGRFRVTEGRR